MYGKFREFIYDESGAATLDSLIVLGGSVWMAFAVVSDVAEASLDLTNDINERLEYANIITEILGEYGPGGSADCAANPGNAKCSGSAGEAPSGDAGDWGDGTEGRSQ